MLFFCCGRWAAADGNIDKWLAARLSATLLDSELVEGLARFATSPSVGTTVAPLGPSAWRLLRGLLEKDPAKRFTVDRIRASGPHLIPAATAAYTASTSVAVETSLLPNNQALESSTSDILIEGSCTVVDYIQRPSTAHVTLTKPLG